MAISSIFPLTTKNSLLLLSTNPNPSSPTSFLVPSPSMAAARPREATPPPLIAKAGRYTVFITPTPGSPRPSVSPRTPSSSVSSHRTSAPVSPVKMPPLPAKAPLSPSPAVPPVQVPPQQFEKSAKGSGSAFGFFWDAIARIQDAHSSLDDYLADWFGLNQSKYQWALNDYYENNGKEMEGVVKGTKNKELVSKGKAV